MFSEWNIISTVIIIFVPVISFDSIDNIFDYADANDDDVFSELQQINITNNSHPSHHTTTTITTTIKIVNDRIKFVKNTTSRNSITPSLQSISNNDVTRQIKKVLTIRTNKRNVITVNRNLSKMCQNVMAICNDEAKSLMIPICDNMNQTHQNPCLFAIFNCKHLSLQNVHSRILVHIGSCNIRSPRFTFEEEVCPTKCSEKIRPVCDTKQQTYRNLCTFQKYNCLERKNNETNASFLYALMACNQTHQLASINEQRENSMIDNQIECPKSKSCHSLRRPVCDSNGRWHRNQCTFLRAQCIAAKRGQRLSLADTKLCSTNSQKKEAKKVSASQRCYRRCPENLTYEPICTTTFVTYPNRCLFLNAKCRDKNLEQLYYGECRDCFTSNCNGTIGEDEPDSNFVCDQAGKTKRKCEFELLRCIYERKFGYNITAAYIGRCCPTQDTCDQSLNNDNKSKGPVCDSQNVTHLSRCHFEMHKCRAEKIQHLKITLLNENGSCSFTTSTEEVQKLPTEINEAMNCNNMIECDKHYEPICGTDGITYVNQCRFIKARCHDKTLLIAYHGECCINRCEQHWSPVCDNHNITHLNLCIFNVQNCIAKRRNNQSLSIVSMFACPDDACNMHCKPNDYQPVCASNGITYQNECELNSVICGLNKQYNQWNLIRNDETKLELDYRGVCCDEITAKCDNNDNLSPICDSEGHTHNNICEYERMACLSRKRFRTNLTIRYWGECCLNNCQHETNKMSLCDDKQTTHDSWCKFRLAQCESHRLYNRTLQVAYMGDCCTILRTENCLNTGPICDTDTVTHRDLCTFRHKQCIMNRTQHKLIKIAYYVSRYIHELRYLLIYYDIHICMMSADYDI